MGLLDTISAYFKPRTPTIMQGQTLHIKDRVMIKVRPRRNGRP